MTKGQERFWMAFRCCQYFGTQSHPLFLVRLNITYATSLTLLLVSSLSAQNFISVPLKSESSLQREVLTLYAGLSHLLPSPTTTHRFILATIQILFYFLRKDLGLCFLFPIEF